ncbi:MAG: C40 family peptidase [Halothiobacillaceae bacterium]
MNPTDKPAARRSVSARATLGLGLLMATLLAGGCSVVREPVPEEPPETGTLAQPVHGSEALLVALGQLGVPYRRGGESRQGFDCSGLVQYAWAGAGVRLPRTAAQQYEAVRKLDAEQLSPGDLVFFRINGRGIDHVGLYRGGGRFVHAPRPGRAVEEVWLDNPYWSRRFAGGGRIEISAFEPGGAD